MNCYIYRNLMVTKLLNQSSICVCCGSGDLNHSTSCSVSNRSMCSPKHESNVVRDIYSCEDSSCKHNCCLLNIGRNSSVEIFNKQSVCGSGDGSMRGTSCDCDCECECDCECGFECECGQLQGDMDG